MCHPSDMDPEKPMAIDLCGSFGRWDIITALFCGNLVVAWHHTQLFRHPQHDRFQETRWSSS